MQPDRKRLRCALYTRKSSEEGLEQSFNSLDAQREACAAYVESQRHEGWKPLEARYDDGGYSGGSMERPGLKALLRDVDAGLVDVVVVYKVDRLTRSLADFAKIVERFNSQNVSFVSVTQQFNTASSMGRLTLNVLLSFAQFERELTGERIRDKVAASKKKGMWMGGNVPLGYHLKDRRLIADAKEAKLIRRIYESYLELGCVRKLAAALKASGVVSKNRVSRSGKTSGGVPYSRGALYSILANRLYIGEVAHRGAIYAGEHEGIVQREQWERVQERLAANSSARRNGAHAEEPSLLAGILYDDEDNRLTPSHCVTRGKRYRYYFCQALISEEAGQPGAVRRLPAAELEALVIKRYCALLASGAAVLDAAMEPDDDAPTRARLIASAKALANGLPKRSTAEARSFILAVTWKIVVAAESIEISVRKSCLRAILLGQRKTSESCPTNARGQLDDLVTLRLEARLRRCGAQTRLVIPPQADSPVGRPDPALIKAIARGHAWYEELMSGSARSLGAIAKRAGVHQRYIGRMIRCAFLAPDIVEAVLAGRQPATLSVERLRRGVPLAWTEQRRLFGFPAYGA